MSGLVIVMTALGPPKGGLHFRPQNAPFQAVKCPGFGLRTNITESSTP
jgi:hypothetical protein